MESACTVRRVPLPIVMYDSNDHDTVKNHAATLINDYKDTFMGYVTGIKAYRGW